MSDLLALADPIVSRPASRRCVALAILLAVVVLAGSAARFVNLGVKFWYHDEATTSLRVSGYDSGDVRRALAGRVFSPQAARRYQRVNGQRGLRSSVGSLAREDPQHPPLFYALAREWAVSVGDSVVSLRSLAALLSLLVMPAMYWLATEVFGRGWERWIVVGLVAISPLQILYAQDAREYGLWAATTAASSAALLRALRLRTGRAWGLYALLLALGLLTDPLTVGVALGHGLYVLVTQRSALWRALRPFAAAAAVAAAAFAPWAYVMATERGALAAGTDWTSSRIPLHSVVNAWLVEAGLPFVDNPAVRQPLSISTSALALAALVPVAVGSTMLWRRGSRRSALFVAALFAGSGLPLMVADVGLGGIRSTVPRFLVPVMLALVLPVAFLIARSLRSPAGLGRLVGWATSALLLGAAAASYASSVGRSVWWPHDDGTAAENLAVTRLLNRGTQPFLITTSAGNVLQMVHYLRPQTRILLVDDTRELRLPPPAAFPILVYGSSSGGAAAQRLTAVLSALRRNSQARLQSLAPALPCCGAGIRQQPSQLWQLTIDAPSRAKVGTRKPHGAAA